MINGAYQIDRTTWVLMMLKNGVCNRKMKESSQTTSGSWKVRTHAFFQSHQFEVFLLDDNHRQRYASLVFVVYFAV